MNHFITFDSFELLKLTSAKRWLKIRISNELDESPVRGG